MKKDVIAGAFFTLFALFLSSNNILAQSFSYELLGNYQIVSDIPDTVKFTPHLSAGFEFCRFEFDLSSEEIDDLTYVFSSVTDSIEVSMIFVATGGDCSSDTEPTLDTTIRKIDPKQAHYTVDFDNEFHGLATLKRVLRSSLNIESNVVENIGDHRFFWVFDEKMIPVPEAEFDSNDPSLGQYPNIYYTFPNGGNYFVTLKVIDIKTPLDTAVFSRNILLAPVFGTDKIDFTSLPNVFSPNGDNENDFFEVVASGTTTLSFKVFARTGALIYQHEGSVIKWDGKNSLGKEVPTGVYYYIIEDIGEKNYNPANGFFHLFRGEK